MFAKTFRNSLVASSLLIGASLLAGPAMAQVSDGDVVSGDVTPINAITFVGTTGTTITGGAAVAAYPMGSLTLQNNAGAGWTLDVASANGGELQYLTNSITYTDLTTAAIAGATVTPVDLATAATDEEVIDAAYNIDVADGVTGVAVTAAIAAGQYVPAGTYSDTLTFTLTSK